MFGIIDQCSDDMVERLTRKVSRDEEKFDMKEWVGNLVSYVCFVLQKSPLHFLFLVPVQLNFF